MKAQFPVLFVSHGGGPLPLLDDSMHKPLTSFLGKGAAKLLPCKPKAVVCVTAHWESQSDAVLLSTSPSPSLLFDYSSFPPESYKFKYPAPGASAEQISSVRSLLKEKGIESECDPVRGFDHGTFVPLMLLFPEAGIPIYLS